MKITSKTFGFLSNEDGEWLLIQTYKAGAVLDEIKKDKLYDVEIKEHREKRSLSANAYAWVLIGKVAEATHVSVTDVYRSYIREIGGNYEIVTVREQAVEAFRKAWEHNGLGWQTDLLEAPTNGYSNIICYYGSSVYTTAQMSRLIDLAAQDCRQLGISTMTPAELEGLISTWGTRNDE